MKLKKKKLAFINLATIIWVSGLSPLIFGINRGTRRWTTEGQIFLVFCGNIAGHVEETMVPVLFLTVWKTIHDSYVFGFEWVSLLSILQAKVKE